MEILIIILLVSLLFPGSSDGGYGPDLGDIAGFVTCGLFLITLTLAWGYSAAGLGMLFDWLEFTHPVFGLVTLLGPIAAPMLIAGIANAIGARRSRVATIRP